MIVSFWFPSLPSEPVNRTLCLTVINVTKKAMFPIERCVDMGRVKQHWLEDLSRDPAYVHTVLYVAQAYFAFVKSQTSLSPMAIMHMNKTMIILRNKLAEANPVLTDSTIYTVLALASVSEALDDLDTAKQHLNGLHQLIRLRGGISALAQKPSLQIKCCRYVPACLESAHSFV